MVDIAPTSERQARPLTALPPEQQTEAWKLAIEKADGKSATADSAGILRIKHSNCAPEVIVSGIYVDSAAAFSCARSSRPRCIDALISLRKDAISDGVSRLPFEERSGSGFRKPF
jgi:hypothetical protein